MLRSFIFFLLLSVLLTGCVTINAKNSGTSPITPGASLAESTSASTCPVTEPDWAKPPEDSAVQGSPAYGFYFVNDDRSIWASAWWAGEEGYHLRVGEEGNKVGWFRPAGALLEISGRRIDGQAPPLDAHVPCCYPTRFQATGLTFPTEGCWEVAARAADTARAATSELTFVVWVEP